jgi:hypothetical protein
MRLVGTGFSGMDDTDMIQGMLFGQEERQKQGWLDAVADEIKDRFGAGAIRRGSGLNLGGKPTPN